MDDPALATSLAAARDTVLVEPRPDLATVVLRGSERVAWLNGLVTCDLATRPSGEATYGLLLEKKGKIRADLLVVDEGDTLVLVVPAAARAAVLEALDHHLVMEDVDLAEAPHEVALLHGPKARALADAAGVPSSADARWGLGSRVVLLAPGGDGLRRLLDGARALGGGEASPGAGGALAVARFVPQFGSDFDGGYYPQEAALEARAVSFSKGCYLGQEVVYMLEHRGREKQRLVPLALEGDALPAPGAAVLDEAGGAIGAVRSAARTEAGLRAIALVKRAHAEPGASLRVDGAPAHVLAPPPPLVGAP